MKAIINTEVAVNNVGIIKTPNHQCNYVKMVFDASYTVVEATTFSSSSSFLGKCTYLLLLLAPGRPDKIACSDACATFITRVRGKGHACRSFPLGALLSLRDHEFGRPRACRSSPLTLSSIAGWAGPKSRHEYEHALSTGS
jgi:hypothetical protein